MIARGSADEHDGRTEQVLATATSREPVACWPACWSPWAAWPGCCWPPGSPRASASGGTSAVWSRPGLAQLPAVWLVVGLAALLYAVRSGWSVAGWGLLGLFLVLGQIGVAARAPGLGDRPVAVRAPPAMPVESFRVAPSLALTAIAAALLTSPRGGATGPATSVSFGAMWQPEPGWLALPGAAPGPRPWACGGPSSVAVRWPSSGSVLPPSDDPRELQRPAALRLLAARRRRGHRHGSGSTATPGLRAPGLTSVEEDDEGITLVQDWVEDAANSGLFCAVALGRFAGADLGDHAWLAQGPAARPAGAGRAPGRLADAGPDHRRGRRRPPLAAPRRAARRARRAAAGGPARRPGPGEPARPRR